MITAASDITGKTITINISHFKGIPKTAKFPYIRKEEEDVIEPDLIRNEAAQHIPNQVDRGPPIRKLYPDRNKHHPSEWRKY